MPHTKRMAPDFLAKMEAASAELQGAQLARFSRMAEQVEREYAAIERAAVEVQRLWRAWAGEEGH